MKAPQVLYFAPIPSLHPDANLQVRSDGEERIWVQFGRGNEILAMRVMPIELWNVGGDHYERIVAAVWFEGERALHRRFARVKSFPRWILDTIAEFVVFVRVFKRLR